MQPRGEIGRFEVEDPPSPPADRDRYRIGMLDSVLVISVLNATWMSYATMQNSRSHVMPRWKANRLFNVVVTAMWRTIRRFPLDALLATQDVGLVRDLRH